MIQERKEGIQALTEVQALGKLVGLGFVALGRDRNRKSPHTAAALSPCWSSGRRFYMMLSIPGQYACAWAKIFTKILANGLQNQK